MGVKKTCPDRIRPRPGQSGLGKTRTACTENAGSGLRISNPVISGHGSGFNTKNLKSGTGPGF